MRKKKQTKINKIELPTYPSVHKKSLLARYKNYIVLFCIVFIVGFLFLLLVTTPSSIKHPSAAPVSLDCFSCSRTLQESYDPFLLSQELQKDQVQVVDIRSSAEFNKGHIRTAINIPTYLSIKNISGTEIKESELINAFNNLAKNKPVIIYGNSASSLPNEIADYLNQHGIRVRPLSIGWNEWRHFPNLWVPESQWDHFSIDNVVEE